MNKRIIFLLSLCVGLLLPLAPAQSAGPVAAAPHRGTLYRIRHHGNTAYLFGTIHVGMASFFPLEPEVRHALSHAHRLVVELDPRNAEAFQQALQRHGMYPDGDTLEHHLSHDALTRLRQALKRFDVPYEKVLRMKPWLVANLLTSLNLERHGYQREQGIEFYFLSIADRRHIPIQELESADYQLGLFDRMKEGDQELYLLETLTQLDNGDALKQDVALIDAWAHAKGDAFEGMLHDTLKGKPTSADFTQRILLGERNPRMADKIAALLDANGSSFVAIGLLHLVGKDGVPALLRRRGYVVEKLY